MISFNYSNATNILFGNKITELPNLLANGKYKNILFLYGHSSIKKNGVYEDVIGQLKIANVTITEFNGVDPNPRYSTVLKAAEVCRTNKIDFILAVGGGSVIDCAKAIAFAACYDGNNFWQEIQNGTVPKLTKALPFGTVLTLAATGSEMNGGSVISNTETMEKLAFVSNLSLPKFSILNPQYTYSVPKNQIACGIVDSFSHCLEQFFSTNSFLITDNILISIMKTIVTTAKTIMHTTNDYNSHANLMWGATMALNGITGLGKVHDWATHNIEHAVSAYYDIHHAVGLAVITPNWMKYVLNEENANRYLPLADVFNINTANKSNIEIANLIINSIASFFKSLDMPATFKEINIDTTNLDKMVISALAAAKSYGKDYIGNFKALKATDIKIILQNSIG